MRVEWFFNGEPLKASHRVRTVYAFGMVVLEIIGTKVSTVEQDLVTSPGFVVAICFVIIKFIDMITFI